MYIHKLYEKLKDKKVGIAGCGGLGSNCASILTRIGLQNFILVDFDHVQKSNLNRQFFFKDQIGLEKVYALKENLLRICPATNIETHIARLTPGLIVRFYSDSNIIIEAFDDAEAKAMLYETMASKLPTIPVIGVSGIAGIENANNMQIIKDGNLTMIGDFKDEVSDDTPPLAPKVSIAAALQANEALKILLNKSEDK